MRNYIFADLRRILRRPGHAFIIFLTFVLYALVVYLGLNNTQVTGVSLASKAVSTMQYVLIFTGLFEMIGVFAEDFRVKTMQVAIGLGVTRTKVVLSKFIEVVCLLVLDAIVVLAITIGIGALLDVAVTGYVLLDVVYGLVVWCLLANIAITSLCMIVLFTRQATLLSLFVYLIIALGIINVALTLAASNAPWLEKLNLNRFLLSSLLTSFYSKLALGTVSLQHLAGIAIYTAGGLVATSLLFKKHELEF